jgi:hypothetical protein
MQSQLFTITSSSESANLREKIDLLLDLKQQKKCAAGRLDLFHKCHFKSGCLAGKRVCQIRLRAVVDYICVDSRNVGESRWREMGSGNR